MSVGFDVGAGGFHAVAVMGRSVRGTALFTDAGEAAAWAVSAGGGGTRRRAAVDSPGGPSVGSHRTDTTVAPKFRGGRCSEVPVRGVPAVPWVTPASLDACPSWMRAGFALWGALRRAGFEVVETFPAACFHHLAGGRWPPRKTSAAGRARRLELLAQFIDLPAASRRWPHDVVDAAVAAVVADRGGALPHSCPRPDGSSLWLI